MQMMTEAVEDKGGKTGLYINMGKRKTIDFNQVIGEMIRKLKLDTAVEVVDDFCCSGSFVSSNNSCDKDCQVRIGKANSVFESYWKVETSMEE